MSKLDTKIKMQRPSYNKNHCKSRQLQCSIEGGRVWNGSMAESDTVSS